MKAKRIRKQVRQELEEALKHNYRFLWQQLCGLSLKTRLKLAWLIVVGDPRIERAT